VAIKGMRKTLALAMILGVALAAHLKGGVSGPLAQVLAASAAAYMAGNGLEHVANRPQPPTAAAPAPQGPPQVHTDLLQTIVGQLKDLGDAMIVLLKKT
jgi:hypothetical protein